MLVTVTAAATSQQPRPALCSSVWRAGTGGGMHIRLLGGCQIPCHKATSPLGPCGKQRSKQKGQECLALDLPLALFISKGTYLPLETGHTDPTHTDAHRALNAPDFAQPAAAGQQGRRLREATDSAAAILGVILAWFVLGQMAELNGLLARLSRILFILRPQSPGKQQVVALRRLFWNQEAVR